MRTAQQVLAELDARGVQINGAGGRIRFRPVDRVDAEMRSDLQRLKPELLALLDLTSKEKKGERAQTPTDRADTGADAQASVSNGTRGAGPFADFAHIGPPLDLAENAETGLGGTDITDRGSGSVVIDGAWYTPDAADLYRNSLPFSASRDECRCCGESRHWRLNSATPWVCAVCHPSDRAATGLEWKGDDQPATTFPTVPPPDPSPRSRDAGATESEVAP